jgi:Uma2 family endonuclease
MDEARSDDVVQVPGSVRFPVELVPPEGFDPARLETWPRVEGRLEWMGGRLLYMPPCGEMQQETVVDVVAALASWQRAHPEFSIGSNEAGMRLGDDGRAADAGVWRGLRPAGWGFRREPPVLAVEVAGRDEGAEMLLDKARWYLANAVLVVWVVLPGEREVVVVTAAGETRHGVGEQLPAHPELPGLHPPGCGAVSSDLPPVGAWRPLPMRTHTRGAQPSGQHARRETARGVSPAACGGFRIWSRLTRWRSVPRSASTRRRHACRTSSTARSRVTTS